MSEQNKKPRCETCPFYVETSVFDGECHYEPPKFVPTAFGISARCVPVSNGGFCSHHPGVKQFVATDDLVRSIQLDPLTRAYISDAHRHIEKQKKLDAQEKTSSRQRKGAKKKKSAKARKKSS